VGGEVKIPATITICVDCLFWLAYGDESAESVPANHGDYITALWGETLLTLGCGVACCGEQPEPWFSWGQCEGCGSRLGGHRQHATAWEETESCTPVH
jgi:hypothetical protein